MFIFEQGKSQSISSFLSDVHDAMKIKYLMPINQDKEDAKELQDFLQGLKKASKNLEASEGIVSLVLQQIKNNHRSNYSIDKLFKRRGGKNFEKELADVVTAVYQASGINFDNIKETKKNISTGTDLSTVLSGVLDNSVLAVLEDMGRGVKRVLDEKGKITSEVSTGKILTNVQQKTDIQGLNLDINISVPGFDRILNLLNKAKISAKNYSSFDKNGKFIDDLYDINIGNSNPYRAFAGALSSFGYGNITINSAFYSSYNNQDDFNVRRHIYHLRYLYELTGAGSGKNIKDRGVNFLIYNDPTGDNIYVKSASEILESVLEDQNFNISDSPFKAINIKKSFFKQNLT